MKRTAIITGATGGIGSAIAYALAQKGFSLALIYNTAKTKAHELENELSKQTTVKCYQCDVGDYKQIEEVVKSIKSDFGFVDTLINNAGISHVALFDTETQQSYEMVMNVNFRSAFTFCNLLVPDMISNKFGRIVNISSVWGQKPASCEVLYSASKSALLGFSRSLNAELAPSNVLVNAVCPGVIDTPMNACFSDETIRELKDSIPMGRLGTGKDVASVVEMLTREQLYVAGEEITISGGW